MPVIVMRKAKEVPIPEGVTARVKSRCIWVDGPRGKLYRNFKHAQISLRIVPLGSAQTPPQMAGMSAEEEAERKEQAESGRFAVLVEKRMSKKKKAAVVHTIAGHIANLFVGVTKGFRYKMRLVYSHFPINATVADAGTRMEIRNYIGQKHVRRIKMKNGVTINEPGRKDEFWIEGNDLDNVSHSAAAIWQSCRVTDKDIRKFLDGCYVYAKGIMGDEKPI